MKKHRTFRDFLYDWNDVVIAVLILLAACLIIFWRVNIIMQYPKHLVKDNSKTISQMDKDESSHSSSSSVIIQR